MSVEGFLAFLCFVAAAAAGYVAISIPRRRP